MLHGFTFVSRKTLICHADECRAIGSRLKNPLDKCGRAVSGPFHEDSDVLLNSFYLHGHGKMIHLPIPRDLFASLQPATALTEPKLRRDGGIHERLEHFGDGFADEHFRFGN